jgi:hypothetical protein
MSTRNVPAVKGWPALKADNLTAICEQIVRKCGSLDVSQPYGPPRPLTRIALHFTFFHKINPDQRSTNGKLVENVTLFGVNSD